MPAEAGIQRLKSLDYRIHPCILPLRANWEARSNQTWTVPIGGGIGRIYRIGKQAVNNRIEFYYNVEKPDSAPDWSWSFTFQLLFPR